MVEAILKDKKKILPCAAYLQGEYGITGLYVGVPCKLGAKGLEQIIEIKLTPEEQAALNKSADAVKELCTRYWRCVESLNTDVHRSRQMQKGPLD